MKFNLAILFTVIVGLLFGVQRTLAQGPADTAGAGQAGTGVSAGASAGSEASGSGTGAAQSGVGAGVGGGTSAGGAMSGVGGR